MMKNYRICKCMIAFIGIMIILLILLGLYFYQFHGELSTEISDWANWSTFFAGIGTMLFTGLNVWVLIAINKSIMRREEELYNFELQKMAINNYRRWMYKFFEPDDEHGTAEIDTKQLVPSKDFLKQLAIYQKVLPTFGSDKYLNFRKDFDEFAKNCFYNDPTDWQNSSEDKEAYVLFMQAREIMFELTNDMLKMQQK